MVSGDDGQPAIGSGRSGMGDEAEGPHPYCQGGQPNPLGRVPTNHQNLHGGLQVGRHWTDR